MKLPKLTLSALIIIFLTYWVLQPAPVKEIYNRNEDPRYHGADALAIGWKGEITAYKWDGKKYVIMWKRKG